MRWVQQLHQRVLSPTETMSFRRTGLGDQGRRVPDEKRFVSFHHRCAKSVLLQASGQPVPANMAGEILFTRTSQEIIRLLMSIIRAGRAERAGLREFTPALPVVARDE